MVEYAAITNKGMVRDVNQDYFLVQENVRPVFIVCDGMGGHASGDVASRSAVQSMSKYIDVNLTYDMDSEKARELLTESASYANKIVRARANSAKEYKGMGTTADICLFDLDMLYVCHVGDSRVYLYREGELAQLTADHTLVEELLQSGTITKEQAESHPNRHMITRAVGTDEEVACDFIEKEMSDGDIILMCTDGLTGMTSENRIKEALMTVDDLQKCAETLVQYALDGGGADNVTIIIIRYKKSERDDFKGDRNNNSEQI